MTKRLYGRAASAVLFLFMVSTVFVEKMKDYGHKNEIVRFVAEMELEPAAATKFTNGPKDDFVSVGHCFPIIMYRRSSFCAFFEL